jgi:uncharacterized membrane protein
MTRLLSGRERLPLILLILALLVGLGLRFSQLGLKPLWMDEVITAIFTTGNDYSVIPLDRALPVRAFANLLSFRSSTCGDIVDRVATQSVHPPLFFCWMHSWLDSWLDSWLSQFGIGSVALRSLPALAGTGLIAIMYGLNRLAFGEKAGVAAAWVMAVSPFGVYLSQEARHYTVPMIAISLGLMGMVRIQQDWTQKRVDPWVWLGWVAVNSLGFYIHYFCILATCAQIAALLGWSLWWGKRSHSAFWVPMMMATATIGLTYAPWFSRFISHIGRPETEWMKPFEPSWWTPFMPVYQLLAGWVLMIVALPVERQLLPVAIVMGLLMVAFSLWIIRYLLSGTKRLLNHPATVDSTLVMTGFLAISVLEFLAIIFLLKKDITQVPRYNFVYFPAVCALLGAALVVRREGVKPFVGLLLVGFISSQFVVNNLAFQKPYQPEVLAENLRSDSGLVVMAYKDYQDIAKGLGFALAIDRVAPEMQFAFMHSMPEYGQLYDRLQGFSPGKNLWLIAPGLKRSEFPERLRVKGGSCRRDLRYYRLGIPYQGYRCD